MHFGLIRSYKRWRHGRGFGVHSPFAYEFITLTLRERLPYYAYERIDAACRNLSDTTLRPDKIKLIFRVVARFSPSTVAIIGESNSKAERLAVKSARQSASIVGEPDDADMVIVKDDCCLGEPSSAGQRVYIFPDMRRRSATTCETLWSRVCHGIRFDNGRAMTIIIASPRFPRQRFDVRF